MGINIHIHHHFENESLILNKIMSLVTDLQQQVADLQAQAAELQVSVDLEQAQIAELLENNTTLIQSLNEQIAALQAQLADSPTPEQLQAVITGLQAVKDSVATSKADLEATV